MAAVLSGLLALARLHLIRAGTQRTDSVEMGAEGSLRRPRLTMSCGPCLKPELTITIERKELR